MQRKLWFSVEPIVWHVLTIISTGHGLLHAVVRHAGTAAVWTDLFCSFGFALVALTCIYIVAASFLFVLNNLLLYIYFVCLPAIIYSLLEQLCIHLYPTPIVWLSMRTCALLLSIIFYHCLELIIYLASINTFRLDITIILYTYACITICTRYNFLTLHTFGTYSINALYKLYYTHVYCEILTAKLISCSSTWRDKKRYVQGVIHVYRLYYTDVRR